MSATNADLSPTEAIPDTVRAYSSQCSGCRRTGTDVMVTFMVSNDPRKSSDNGNCDATIYDMFLSKEQAIELSRSLMNAVNE